MPLSEGEDFVHDHLDPKQNFRPKAQEWDDRGEGVDTLLGLDL
jgi:hypothetical protein